MEPQYDQIPIARPQNWFNFKIQVSALARVLDLHSNILQLVTSPNIGTQYDIKVPRTTNIPDDLLARAAIKKIPGMSRYRTLSLSLSLCFSLSLSVSFFLSFFLYFVDSLLVPFSTVSFSDIKYYRELLCDATRVVARSVSLTRIPQNSQGIPRRAL